MNEGNGFNQGYLPSSTIPWPTGKDFYTNMKTSKRADKILTFHLEFVKWKNKLSSFALTLK